jgi:hypothetical protein
MNTPAEACPVSKARRAGLAPPKRKCTCESGITIQRHSVSTVQSSSRSSASQRIEIRVLGLPPDLVDKDDTLDFRDMVLSGGEVISVLNTTEESSDYWPSHENVIQASESGNVAAVRSLLEGSVVANLATRYEASTEWTRREALGVACANGRLSLVWLWLDDGGLQLSDRCFECALSLQEHTSSCMSMVSTWKLGALSTCTQGSFNLEILRVLKDPCASSQHSQKRQRAYISTYDRAVSVGVAHRLHAIPSSLQRCIEGGCDEEIAAAKKEIHKLQKANQKIVARAEQQRLKQTRLAFATH